MDRSTPVQGDGIAGVLTGAAAGGCLAGTAIGIGRIAPALAANDYWGEGLRTLFFLDLAGGALEGALAGTGALLALALLYLAARRVRGDAVRALALAAATGLVAPAWLAVGYAINRNHLKEFWKVRAPLFGVNLPEGLTKGYPLLVNGLVTIGALFLVWVLSRIAVAILRRRGPGGRGAAVFRARLRRIALVVAFLVAAGRVWVAIVTGGPGTPVLIVSIDTLRADHLGCYGYVRDTSPNLDRLARDGIRFAECFSQAPTTLPSHISIMTSLYPSVHRVVTRWSRLRGRIATLAEVIHNEGYATGAFVDGGFLRARFGFRQGFEVYQDHGRGIARLARRAASWMKRRKKKFFCFLHCYDVHSPYDPPPPFDTLFQEPEWDGDFEPSNQNLIRYARFFEGRGKRELEPLTAGDVDRMVALYDGGIRYTDGKLGALFEEMRREGFYDEALIVVTSDHGEEFLEHGSLLHSELYRTVVHVPLLIKPPAGSPWASRAGSVVDEPVESIDIFPSVLEILRIPAPGGLSGRSVWTRSGRADRSPPPAFSEYEWKERLRAITTGRYRLIRALDSQRLELYDRSADREETSNLAAAEPETLATLLEQLGEWIERQEKVRLSFEGELADTAALDETTINQLKALGYIE